MSKLHIDDRWLSVNMKAADDLMMQQLPDNSELHHEFSERYMKKKRKLLKREHHAGFWSFTRNVAHKAAVILIVIVATFATLTISVEAFRELVFEKITTLTDNWSYTSFIIDERVPLQYNHEAFTFMPEEFKLSDELIDDTSHYAIYENTTGAEIQTFTYYKVVIDESLVISSATDTEEYKELVLNNISAELYFIDSTYILHYQKSGYYYMFTGINMSENEFIGIVESLTLNP